MEGCRLVDGTHMRRNFPIVPNAGDPSVEVAQRHIVVLAIAGANAVAREHHVEVALVRIYYC